MTTETEFLDSLTFDPGEQMTSDFFKQNFSGRVWLKMLSLTPACPIGNVTFEPGCINNWHEHEGGQTLLVTAGRGWYQEWGKPARELKPGDVVDIPAHVKHWHGAATDSWFSHFSVEVDAEKGPAKWLEPVDRAEYDKLP